MFDIEQLLVNALDAAQQAATAAQLALGDNDSEQGIVWASIPNDYHEAISALKSKGLISASEYENSYRISSVKILPNCKSNFIVVKKTINGCIL